MLILKADSSSQVDVEVVAVEAAAVGEAVEDVKTGVTRRLRDSTCTSNRVVMVL